MKKRGIEALAARIRRLQRIYCGLLVDREEYRSGTLLGLVWPEREPMFQAAREAAAAIERLQQLMMAVVRRLERQEEDRESRCQPTEEGGGE